MIARPLGARASLSRRASILPRLRTQARKSARKRSRASWPTRLRSIRTRSNPLRLPLGLCPPRKPWTRARQILCPLPKGGAPPRASRNQRHRRRPRPSPKGPGLKKRRRQSQFRRERRFLPLPLGQKLPAVLPTNWTLQQVRRLRSSESFNIVSCWRKRSWRRNDARQPNPTNVRGHRRHPRRRRRRAQIQRRGEKESCR